MTSDFPAPSPIPSTPAIADSADSASTADSEPVSVAEPAAEAVAVPQVRFKTEAGRLLLLLTPENEIATPATAWADLWQQLKHRLNAGERFWPKQAPVYLIARDRLLDSRQLQAIADVLSEAQLQLKRVYTSRRQTAVAAATAGFSVEQQMPIAHLHQTEPAPPLADPLYIETTVRSGVEIRHPGTVVVLGDVNPGSSIIADGDVLVWGALRGVAQAGAAGNLRCLIMALRMDPTQIRIADFVARAPEIPPDQYTPEVAYVAPEGIRIARAIEFSKERLFPSAESTS